ncbi:MAG: hypothetical protein OEY22_10320 [Candidatus Bathyarchaeota archaeon]|nr:hypothetical protein [Candidatus Bathyarchaeota archaeon]MDH5787196.1 hypothetical protein [Candidatus Bathyarchaeota archaeon]
MKNRLSSVKVIVFLAISLLLISGILLNLKPVLGKDQLLGAIWTTDPRGEQVNGNLYSNPRDVYLVGGPHKAGALDFAQGWYCFQVTDPSGNLLSTDGDEDRRFFVNSEGRITQAVNHRLKIVNGKGIVQLWPFQYSPKNGGEYKVWVTSETSYNIFGFIPSLCKTDNFKVGKWTNDVVKYFELWVTDGVSGLSEVEFYVNYRVDPDGPGPLPPGPWTSGQLTWVPNPDPESPLDVFQYDTTFTIGSYIYWQFTFSNAVGLMPEIHGPELITGEMTNKEFLFRINGHHYNSRPTEDVKVPVEGSHIVLSNGTHTVDTYTDEDGYYEFIAVVPEVSQTPWDYKVSLIGNSLEILAWFEHQADSAVDETFDFYDFAAYMSNLEMVTYPEIPTFHIVWTPSNEGEGLYKLSSTNPGSFHFNIESCGAPGSPVFIEIFLPPFGANDELDSPNFFFHHQYIGGTYVLDLHVYDAESDADITADFTFVESGEKNATISGVMPDSGEIILSLHLDYQIEGSLTQTDIDKFDSFEYIITVLTHGSIRGVRFEMNPG